MHVLASKKEQITLKFGKTTLNGSQYNHTGIDLVKSYNQLDTVIAVQKGKVIGVRKDIRGFLNNSYGNYVKLQHDDGYETLYCHLAYGRINVNVGDIVEEGQELGYMGATGMAYGAHLHFEVRKNGTPINPKPFLDGQVIPAYNINPSPITPTNWVDYTIQSGDDLNTIANERGTTAQEIQKYNGRISDINHIVTGWIIKVPPMPVTSSDSLTTMNVGDDVIVNGIGYASSDGTGSQTRTRVEQRMKLVKIANGAKFPYGCNQNMNMNGITAYWSKVRKA